MKSRCSFAAHKGYKHYGGRGIRVCDRWVGSFENFLADMGERPDDRTLDRIDVDGPYSPENCRWATWEQQCDNKRDPYLLVSYGGEMVPIQRLARQFGINRYTLYRRIQRGWPEPRWGEKPRKATGHALPAKTRVA